jgi:hypothetical protein
MNESIYVPGLWYCAKCDFSLVQSNLYIADGTVGPRDDPGDKCPNCHAPLWRVTWKRHAYELADRCEAAIIEMAALREALDRIARFEECFAAATDKHPGNEAGAAMAQTLANYARSTLSSPPSKKEGDR